jgi:hypothetical protein
MGSDIYKWTSCISLGKQRALSATTVNTVVTWMKQIQMFTHSLVIDIKCIQSIQTEGHVQHWQEKYDSSISCYLTLPTTSITFQQPLKQCN